MGSGQGFISTWRTAASGTSTETKQEYSESRPNPIQLIRGIATTGTIRSTMSWSVSSKKSSNSGALPQDMISSLPPLWLLSISPASWFCQIAQTNPFFRHSLIYWDIKHTKMSRKWAIYTDITKKSHSINYCGISLLIARLEGLEPPISRFVAAHSIRLSYRRMIFVFHRKPQSSRSISRHPSPLKRLNA